MARQTHVTASAAQAAWQRQFRQQAGVVAPAPSLSGIPIEPLYTPAHARATDVLRDIGWPGQFPFTRGIHASMYRHRPWTMREFAGFGSARDTNARFRFLLRHGQTGLSVAFDMPTLMGYDSDHPLSLGEVGRGGVAIDTLDDMLDLFRGIRLDRVSTSMTINGPAIVLLAMYIATATQQGVSPRQLRGTIQNDILKEYMAQREWIFPPRPSLRLIVDTVRYCARAVPKWHPISISGYHIREAGSTAQQELAFTLANGFTYVEELIKSGMHVDAFAPRLSFFFNAHMDLFEEVAKFRAARRIWARHLRHRYHAKDPRSWQLRFHVQTAGSSLTAQQPENNITRTAYEALSAVLGGAQSVHTNALDEPLCLPSPLTAQIALRTQQILAHETGVARTADPLGGSYYVESLTTWFEQETQRTFAQIRTLGGVLAGLEQGYFQRAIADAAQQYQRVIEEQRWIQVGVNAYAETAGGWPLSVFRVDPQVERLQRARLRLVKRRRSSVRVQRALDRLQRVAETSDHLMPATIEAVTARATIGEICAALKQVFGEYREPTIV